MKLLFWDIDGTLMRTGKAGLYAFQEAAQDMLGCSVDFDKIQTAGMTDYHIAAQIFSAARNDAASRDEICAMVKRYEEALPHHLAERQGCLMPNVKEILAWLHDKPNFVSLLLTGNTEEGARNKLVRYGLSAYFDLTLGAFGNDCMTRSEVAAKALTIARTNFPAVAADCIYVIGDTPNDIACGKEIGARTVAVATGGFSLDILAACSPWWALKCLPDPCTFENRLLFT